MEAYSYDLRKHILMAVDSGVPKSEVARNFQVARSTVISYVARRRDTGDVKRKPIPGRPARIASQDYPALVAQLEADPDAILEEHCRNWEQKFGTPVSIWAMQRAITRVGWTRKKR